MTAGRDLPEGQRAPLLPRAPLPADTAPATMLCVSSAALFGTATEIQIDHHGAVYRLRHTSSGKLILTK